MTRNITVITPEMSARLNHCAYCPKKPDDLKLDLPDGVSGTVCEVCSRIPKVVHQRLLSQQRAEAEIKAVVEQAMTSYVDYDFRTLTILRHSKDEQDRREKEKGKRLRWYLFARWEDEEIV